jgi:hypothetical protein
LDYRRQAVDGHGKGLRNENPGWHRAGRGFPSLFKKTLIRIFWMATPSRVFVERPEK